MDQFNGIRAERRRKGDRPAHPLTAGPALTARLVSALLLGLLAPAGAAANEPAAAPAPPTAAAPSPAPSGPAAAPAPMHAPEAPALPARPQPRPSFVTDALTGLALGGYDPVAYFIAGRPVLGRSEFEWDWGGTSWRFADQGDLAAFRDAPEIYAPLFGGRCAFAVAHGWPAEGSPQYHLIVKSRLLLFADAVSRAAFATDPERLLAEAERRWPGLAADLP